MVGVGRKIRDRKAGEARGANHPWAKASAVNEKIPRGGGGARGGYKFYGRIKMLNLGDGSSLLSI